MRRGGRQTTNYLLLVVPRRKGVTARLLLLVLSAAALAAGWALADRIATALLYPLPTTNTLDHLRINRSLKSYLDNITLLLEPSPSCAGAPVVAVVTSTPHHFDQRMAIRETWGRHLPTYFILGLNGTAVEDLLVDNYIEAKEHRDMIVYQFRDHYQNLTIKTALLVRWAAAACPGLTFLFKVDDDILVNPWTLKDVVNKSSDANLIGYRKENSYVHRDEHNKWYLPRWLLRPDLVPEYLSGTAYLINGRHLTTILHTAFNIPMINLEDVYFTHLVASELGLTLTHDRRLSPYKPWAPAACLYWTLASAHSLTPQEMTRVWPGLSYLGEQYDTGQKVCGFYEKYLNSELLLY
ncbi:beta-1,3-galactosyltransferase 5-like [Aricia agestis]|uniref:beta-1,3-galactosyltransferase 5-like n=1 Tax=Aricia agestis TaxID=91739 RepID=UPI001C206A75|nr:beta-1,3-galactosyltransferase 5-like [Aricia agestis]